MEAILRNLQKYYKDKRFLVNLNQENELTKYFKKELDISTPEANIFGVILFNFIKTGFAVSIRDLCEDFNIPHSHYLKIMEYIFLLEDKGYVLIDSKGRKSRMLNPDIEVDEIIFKKLIYGRDVLEDCDFNNIYSILEVIKELIEMRNEEEISFKYFLRSIKTIIKNVNKKTYFYEILNKYSLTEDIMFLYTLIAHLDNWSKENININEFADFMDLRLNEKMKLLDKIVSKELPIFNDKILEIVKGENELFSSATDVNIHVNPIVKAKLFKRKLKNFKLNSILLKQISIKDINCKQKLYFKKDFEKELKRIKNFLSKKRFKNIKKELRKRGYSEGAVLLFYGEPGTGKTASAYEIAKETNREILQVDFSQVQSMWVGESEKNMKKIFNEYRIALENMELEPILLFNEADSLISKRVNVRDSVDQMTNTLQNILLEELENFEGIFIATTNLIDNIDPAFDRRFIYKLKFSLPDKEIRKKIWKNKLPELKSKEIEQLAKYNLSGGQIDNIVKKYIINLILDDSNLNISEILKYIDEEINFRNSKSKVIGFTQY